MSDNKDRQSETNPAEDRNKNWVSRCIKGIQRELEKRSTDKKSEATIDKAARSTARATWALVFFTVVLGAIGYLQYKIISSQLEEMKSASAQVERSIAAALASAKAAEDQVLISRADSRAFIGLPQFDTIAEAEGYSFRIVFPNTGRNIARNISVIASVRDAFKANVEAEATMACAKARANRNIYDLGPNDRFAIGNVPGYIDTLTTIEQISAAHRNIVGCIVYSSGTDPELLETPFYATLLIKDGKPAADVVYALKTK